MSEIDTASLIYLVILGGALVFLFAVNNSQSIGKLAQHAVTWVLIFLGVIAAVGLWGDIRNSIMPGRATLSSDQNQIEVPRAPDGHYYLTLDVNGKAVEFVVDTGATNVVLTKADAAKVGLDVNALEFVGRAGTANGTVRTAPVRLNEVRFGPITDRNLRAWVNEGELDHSLLGMNYLQNWRRIEIADGALILTR